MIVFKDLSNEIPFKIFHEKYHKAISLKQKNIEAMSIASFDNDKSKVDTRYVNLKFIIDNKFIFFTNYNSPKSLAFQSFNQIAALFYWPSINTQIRIRGNISKTDKKFNEEYFKKRSKNKNALAISSNQSNEVSSYEEVIRRYKDVIKDNDLLKCPNYWGGYAITPYEIEFWEANAYRLNKRNLYIKQSDKWILRVLEP